MSPKNATLLPSLSVSLISSPRRLIDVVHDTISQSIHHIMASYSLLGDVDSWSKWMAVHTPAWMRDRKSSVLRITGFTAAVIIAIMLFVTVGFPTSPAPYQQSPVTLEHDHSEPIKPRPPPTPVCSAADDKNWKFDAARDARNLGLSEWQCNVRVTLNLSTRGRDPITNFDQGRLSKALRKSGQNEGPPRTQIGI